MANRFDEDDEFDALFERHRRRFSCEPNLAARVRRTASRCPPPSRWRLAWERIDARCETMVGSVLFVAGLMIVAALLGMAWGERSKQKWLAQRQGELEREERRLEASYLARIDPLLRVQLREDSRR